MSGLGSSTFLSAVAAVSEVMEAGVFGLAAFVNIIVLGADVANLPVHDFGVLSPIVSLFPFSFLDPKTRMKEHVHPLTKIWSCDVFINGI